MTSEDWKSAWDLYQAVCDLPAQDQRACLESSGLRPEILAEVRVLLENSEKPSAGAASPTPGASFGRYVIVGRIGSGGMGDVYLARDTELDRSIALKFLNPERSGSLSAEDRFIREAKAASALNHPNIVTIHEVIRSESALAIAMERIEGKALRDFQGTPLPLEQVVRLGRQVADALAAAHDQGIVHRDIKPENVMVRPDGLVKVLDFGLARRLRTNDRTSTAGLAAGTLRYMSPEQARGEELSGATDIFSLGIMLYELAVGQYPFESGSPFGTVQAIVVSDPLRPSQVRRTIPKGFDALVLSMLAKSPGERPSAREVVRALDQIQLASAPPRRLGWRLYAGLAVAIIVLGGVFLFVRERNQEAPVWRALPFTSQTGQQVAPSFSPDGRTVAFVLGSASGNRFSICTKPLGGGQQSCLTPPDESEFSPAWSPDGNWIGYVSGAFGSKNTVWIRSRRTGEKRKISDIASGNWPVRRALGWTPDGKALLLTASSALYELTLDGGKRRQLTQPPEDAADYFPAVSRDGRQLLFTRFDRGVATVYVTPLDQPGPLTAIVPPDLSSAVWAAGCWRPNQREIILVASTAGVSEIWVHPLSGKPALLARISSCTAWMSQRTANG